MKCRCLIIEIGAIQVKDSTYDLLKLYFIWLVTLREYTTRGGFMTKGRHRHLSLQLSLHLVPRKSLLQRYYIPFHRSPPSPCHGKNHAFISIPPFTTPPSCILKGHYISTPSLNSTPRKNLLFHIQLPPPPILRATGKKVSLDLRSGLLPPVLCEDHHIATSSLHTPSLLYIHLLLHTCPFTRYTYPLLHATEKYIVIPPSPVAVTSNTPRIWQVSS